MHPTKHLAWLAAMVLATTFAAAPARAYNSHTHYELAQYAYDILTAQAKAPLEIRGATPQQASQFNADLKAGLEFLRQMPGKLPNPKASLCADLTAIDFLHTNTPNWGNGGKFFEMKIGDPRFPIAADYIVGNDCGIDGGWKTGPGFAATQQDFGGTVLGVWARRPDDFDDEYKLGVKVTNAGYLSWLKEAAEAAGAAGAGTIWVSVKCGLTCLEGFLSFSTKPCKDCIKEAVQEAKDAVHDGVSEIDSWVPVWGEYKNGDLLTGMCHHLNIPLANSDYDDVSGLLIATPGPTGVQGFMESLANAAADAAGATVNYDESQAPKRYEVLDGHDGHANSKHRDQADWEYLAFNHIPMNPVDNLAWYGLDHVRADMAKLKDHQPIDGPQYLGWALHAIGDATVPMHAAGTFGYGHRPYEDAVDRNNINLMRGKPKEVQERVMRETILPRALVWRRFILDWRGNKPERAKEIPIRDIVTGLARQTWALSKSQPELYDDALSTVYMIPKVGKDAATVAFEVKAMDFAQDRLNEATAASIAVLMSLREIAP